MFNHSTCVNSNLLILQAAALNHIFESGIVSNALSKAIGDLGWTGCQAPAAPPSVIKQMDKKSGKKSGKEEGVKEKSRRPIGPYMLFMNLMMERISKDPQNPAFKVLDCIGKHCQHLKLRCHLYHACKVYGLIPIGPLCRRSRKKLVRMASLCLCAVGR